MIIFGFEGWCGPRRNLIHYSRPRSPRSIHSHSDCDSIRTLRAVGEVGVWNLEIGIFFSLFFFPLFLVLFFLFSSRKNVELIMDNSSISSLSDSYSLASSISNTILPCHEFGRELLWRVYPTDQRGSYFRKFWDRSDADDSEVNDIDVPLHQWNDALGANTNIGGDYLILVIRGELLRKFPNTLIFAQEASFVEPIPTTATQMENAPRIPKAGGTTVYPKFTAQLEQDVTLVAFEMTKETALGKNSQGVNINAGYFFCLQERPGEMRFGLSGDVETDPNNWVQLSWGRISNPMLLKSDISIPSTIEAEDYSWFLSSSDMASILIRQPMNFVIESKSFI